MFISMDIVLFILVAVTVSLRTEGVTDMTSSKKPFKSDGDLILTAMFPITISKKQNKSEKTAECSLFELGVYLAEAFRYAVKKVNDEDMLKGMKLGYEIRDTCSRIDKSVKIALDVNDRVKNEQKNNGTDAKVNKIIAVIGAGKSELSITVNNILSARDIPQVSYASTSKLLSDKYRFPTFSRTIPTDTLQAKVIAELLSKFDWTYVTLVYTDDNYGRPLAASLFSYSDSKGICFADIHKLRRQVTDAELADVVSGMIRHEKANVVVVFLNSIISERLVKMARLNKVSGKIWVFTGTWYNSKKIFQENSHFLDGSIGVVDEIITVPEMYSDMYKNITWWSTLDKSNGKDPESVTFSDGIPYGRLIKIPYVVNAVFAVVNAINIFCMDNDLVTPHECQKHIQPYSITQHLRNITFKGINNHDVFLNQNGDPINNNIELYSVVGGNHTQLVRVGLYIGLNDTLLTSLGNVKWNGETTLPSSKCSLPCPRGYYNVDNVMSKCCWQCVMCSPGEFNNETNSKECIRCPEGTKPNGNRTHCTVIISKYLRWTDTWAIFISVLSVLSSLVAFIFFVLFIYFRNTPVVRASDREFSLLLLLSFVVGLTLPIMYPGIPTNFRCRFQEILPSVVYTLTLSLIIARINRTALIFNIKRVSNVQKMFVRRSMQFFLVLFLISTQLVVCLIWLSSRPPYAKEMSFNDYGLIFCHFNSIVYFLLSKSILLLLSCTCVGMALISRHIPCRYNNARHILFALLTFKVTFLTGIVGRFYGDSGSIVDSLTIFVSYSSLLYLMFSTKVYILLLRKDLNTAKVFRERTWAFTLKNQTTSLASLQFSSSTLDKQFVNNKHMLMGDISRQDKAVQTDGVFFSEPINSKVKYI